MKLITPSPPANDPFAPKGRRGVPVPEDLAEHRPIVPYDDGGDFGEQIEEVHCAAAALVRDPPRDVALALQGLSYAEKIELATALRSSVGCLNARTALMLEARS